MTPRLCECGCGAEVRARFVFGHQRRRPEIPRFSCIANRPEHIVGWVNANGGEAYYDAPVPLGNRGVQPAAIAVSTINGWAFAAPGNYVVMGDATFHVGPLAGGVSHKRRDFYPCDPETFERRWEAAS